VAHRAAVRTLERETAHELDIAYRHAKNICLAYLDTLLQQMQQERKRLAQHLSADSWKSADDEDEQEAPAISLSWLDGPQGRLIQLTAHIEGTITMFAQHAGKLITHAHEQATAAGHDAAVAVLVARQSPDSGQDVQRPPVGTLTHLAGRAANGQPVASLLDGLGRQVANEVARTLRNCVRLEYTSAAIRGMVGERLDEARNRAHVVLTDSLWRGTNDAMMAVFRANRRM
jgi:hypothetical protein